MNKVIIIGRLASNVEVYESKNLTKYIRCRIAVQKENNRDDADFVPLVAFSNTATFMTNYFSKGDLVSVDGSLSATTYRNDKNELVESISVVVQNIRSLEPKSVVDQRRNGRTNSTANVEIKTKTNIGEIKEEPSFYKENKENENDGEDDFPWEIDI